MAEQAESPDICPKCGVVYAKVQAQRGTKGTVRQGPAVASQMAAAARPSPPRKSGSDSELVAIDGDVVVTGVNIPFFSLIWLMTKIILAALPAIALATLIVVMLSSFIGGVFTSYNKYSSSAPSVASDEVAAVIPAETPDRQEVVKQCRSFADFAEVLMQGRQSGVSMTTAMGEGESELISQLVVRAYEKPRYSTAEMQRKEVEDFKNDVYLECVKNMR